MDKILAGVQWTTCLVYIDDLVIAGRMFEEHLRNLVEVFKWLRKACLKLKLKPSKCNFCSLKVEFLGHIVSADGIHTDPNKVKVAHWPTPTSKKEVQQFLGFATLAKPLHRLTEKTATFEWTEECHSAFDALRTLLVTSPVLAFPDYSREFILDTDANDTGLGAVLSQVQDDGTERVVAIWQPSFNQSRATVLCSQKEVASSRHICSNILDLTFSGGSSFCALTMVR